MMKEEMICGYSLPSHRATEILAREMASLLRAGDLVILTGDLGAGKTYLSGSLLYGLGLDEEERVTSPTYTLVNEYETTPPVYHCDLYRLSEDDEVYELGLSSQRLDGAIVIAEWGTPYLETLGGDAIHLQLELEPRRALFPSCGERQREFCQSLQEALKTLEGELSPLDALCSPPQSK
ncbi:MAG: tRNA (adenosine(37)-N6)-threonylcarbamoyltransferase complex ATPase subunit type 1 TsaE [Polyangiaceae bacterium]|nr:tRNA (adenosine(37)-N6)-threonylcarbamoyltransferase complex ATPase subunit type 1 TsaE [Polyangiaceae bacterium]